LTRLFVRYVRIAIGGYMRRLDKQARRAIRAYI
jgi:hypothetical protein